MDKTKRLVTTKPDFKLFHDLCKSLTLNDLYCMRATVTNAISSKRHTHNVMPNGSSRKDFSSPKYAYDYLMNEDWSDLFSNCDDGAEEYYVYFHVDPRKSGVVQRFNYDGTLVTLPIPFYVGVGSGHRGWTFNKRSKQHQLVLRELEDSGFVRDEIVFVFRDGLSRSVALEFESKMILYFGCRVSACQNRIAMFGGDPTLLNQRYEPYPEEYNSLHMCHAVI